jgi:hypothetical protein
MMDQLDHTSLPPLPSVEELFAPTPPPPLPSDCTKPLFCAIPSSVPSDSSSVIDLTTSPQRPEVISPLSPVNLDLWDDVQPSLKRPRYDDDGKKSAQASETASSSDSLEEGEISDDSPDNSPRINSSRARTKSVPHKTKLSNKIRHDTRKSRDSRESEKRSDSKLGHHHHHHHHHHRHHRHGSHHSDISKTSSHKKPAGRQPSRDLETIKHPSHSKPSGHFLSQNHSAKNLTGQLGKYGSSDSSYVVKRHSIDGPSDLRHRHYLIRNKKTDERKSRVLYTSQSLDKSKHTSEKISSYHLPHQNSETAIKSGDSKLNNGPSEIEKPADNGSSDGQWPQTLETSNLLPRDPRLRNRDKVPCPASVVLQQQTSDVSILSCSEQTVTSAVEHTAAVGTSASISNETFCAKGLHADMFGMQIGGVVNSCGVSDTSNVLNAVSNSGASQTVNTGVTTASYNSSSGAEPRNTTCDIILDNSWLKHDNSKPSAVSNEALLSASSSFVGTSTLADNSLGACETLSRNCSVSLPGEESNASRLTVHFPAAARVSPMQQASKAACGVNQANIVESIAKHAVSSCETTTVLNSEKVGYLRGENAVCNPVIIGDSTQQRVDTSNQIIATNTDVNRQKSTVDETSPNEKDGANINLLDCFDVGHEFNIIDDLCNEEEENSDMDISSNSSDADSEVEYGNIEVEPQCEAPLEFKAPTETFPRRRRERQSREFIHTEDGEGFEGPVVNHKTVLIGS